MYAPNLWPPRLLKMGELVGRRLICVVAEHTKTGQKVALKFIDRAKLSRDTNDRVEREIQYLKLLRHPHIIKLYFPGRIRMYG